MTGTSRDHAATRHLPRAAPIEAYGNGGFRFGGMSHRGSLLCLPDGIWASAVRMPDEVDADALAPVLARDSGVGHLLIGTGQSIVPLPAVLRDLFRPRRIAVETMTTGAAVRTYNILLDERRPVAALLLAVG